VIGLKKKQSNSERNRALCFFSQLLLNVCDHDDGFCEGRERRLSSWRLSGGAGDWRSIISGDDFPDKVSGNGIMRAPNLLEYVLHVQDSGTHRFFHSYANPAEMWWPANLAQVSLWSFEGSFLLFSSIKPFNYVWCFFFPCAK